MEHHHDLLRNGEVVITTMAYQELDRWHSVVHIRVRRFEDHRDLVIPSPGTFATESEAKTEALHFGIAWVHREFPANE